MQDPRDIFNEIRTILISLILISSPYLHAKTPDRECILWLQNAKIAPGSKGCELKCATLMVDMETFVCPNQCDLLCKQEVKSSIPGKLLYYPGLTPAEKRLVEKYPKEALNVFVQKTRAELSSSRNFPDQNMNDESDAFRHFIWAGLLTKELGTEKAKEFLDAHEEDPEQPPSERAMDLHNNNKGQRAAEMLIQKMNGV